MAYLVSLLPGSSGDENVEGEEDPVEGFCSFFRESGRLEEMEPGRLAWRFGRSRLDIRVVHDGAGRFLELEVMLPFGSVVDESDSLMESLFDAAERCRFRVFDPQLGRSVGKSDLPSITSRFEAASRYHAQYSGLAEAAHQGPSSASVSQKSSLLSPRAVGLLVIVGALILGYLIFRVLVVDPFMDSFSLAPKPELERPSGPPPGWLDRHPPPE